MNTNLGVHVGSVHVDLPSMLMDDSTDLIHSLLVHS